MHLLGLSFILYLLKLSAGNNLRKKGQGFQFDLSTEDMPMFPNDRHVSRLSGLDGSALFVSGFLVLLFAPYDISYSFMPPW